MATHRCPECGAEAQLEARLGGEIVSVYCLRHIGGAEAYRRPVYMTMVTELAKAGWLQAEHDVTPVSVGQ